MAHRLAYLMERFRHPTPLGTVLLDVDAEGLCGLRFADADVAAAAGSRNTVAEQSATWLDAYFAGNVLPPLPPLHVVGTPFCRAVWRLLPEIPRGATVSYGRLAERLYGSNPPRLAARAVGRAVGRNPIWLMLPCHRVVAAHSLGGYEGGVDLKRRLLAHEGALTANNELFAEFS